MPAIWVDPYVRMKTQVVKGHLRMIGGKPTKTTNDKKREWAYDLGYSVTRASRAMHLGIEREWKIFNDLNPDCMNWDTYWMTYGN
jgi:hypothetical protein